MDHAGAGAAIRRFSGLARALTDHGYTREALNRSQIFHAPRGVDPHAVALERCAGATPLERIMRLFAVGGELSRSDADHLLAPAAIDDLVAGGLLVAEHEGVRSRFALTPFGDAFFAHDFGVRPIGTDAPNDVVLGIGTMTTLLALLTVRRGREVVFDLGTGQGFQAIVAAGHAERVIASDSSARSVEATRIGAAIAGAANVEVAHGHGFGPIVGLEGGIDLIVCNPPFVIAPSHRIEALTGQGSGDAFCRTVVRGAAANLREDGFATILVNWPHAEEDRWHEIPDEWATDISCDAWTLRFRTVDVGTYVAQWIVEATDIGGATAVPPMQEWLRYFAESGFRHVSTGAIVLRRRAGSNWRARESVSVVPAPPSASAQIERIFRNRTALAGFSDRREILDRRLTVTAAHACREDRRLSGGGWVAHRRVLEQTDGFDFSMQIDQTIADVLAELQNGRTAGTAINSIGRARKKFPGALVEQAVPILIRMLEVGHLEFTVR